MLRSRLALTIFLATVVAACAGNSPATGTPAPSSGSSGPSGASASAGAPSGTPASEAPSGEPTEAPTATPTTGPSASPSGSADTGPAAACTGTDDNKAFFADAAASVDWAVVCAVLPNKWFVSEGSRRGGGGGRLTISYKGPNGATLTLSEGAWCTDPATCVPAGTEVGPAKLGPMDGTLLRLDDGGFAIVVDRGEAISWLFQTSGIGKTKSTDFAAAAAVVGD